MRETTKRVGDIFDLSLDWTDALAEIGDGEEIVDSAWELLTGTIYINDTLADVGDVPAHSHSEHIATVWMSGGEEGEIASLKNSIVTTGGRKLDEVVRVTVTDEINEGSTGRYASLARMENIFGRFNVSVWAKIEDVPTGDVDARIAEAIADADDYIDGQLRGSVVKVLPIVDPPRIITRIASTLAGIWLYETRGVRDQDDAGNTFHRYSAQKKWAEDMLTRIRNGRHRIADSTLRRHPQVVIDCDDGADQGLSGSTEAF